MRRPQYTIQQTKKNDSMNLNIRIKTGKISAIPGHVIKDGVKCGKLQAPAGFFDSCECTNVKCEKPESNIESVTIQRIKYDRNELFPPSYLNRQFSIMEANYAKPIRTFLVIKEVKFH